LELRLKHIIEGKREGARKRGRRRKQLLNYVKETKRYCILKEEELDHILEDSLMFTVHFEIRKVP